MKVGIVTIHNVSNYGAVLQAYALKEVFKKYSETYIIDFDNKHVSRSLNIIRGGNGFHGFLGICKDIVRFVPRIKVIGKFNKFINEKLDLLSLENISDFGLDILCSGSDQIWNPACISNDKQFIREYFLDLNIKVKKKISYASSCGSYKFSTTENKKLKEYLSTYDAISVREKATSDFFSKLLERDIVHVLDPTLLLRKDEWLDKVGDNNFRECEYILVYVIKKTALIKKVVSQIKKKLGLRVILIDQGLYFSQDVDEHIRDAGPVDFISLFNNAKFIVTDSFHGTTFSVIFEKPFLSVSPGANVNRISSLLSKLELGDRIVYDDINCDRLISDHLFDEASKKLDIERERSLNFIETCLSERK